MVFGRQTFLVCSGPKIVGSVHSSEFSVFMPNKLLLVAGFHMIADDRGSQIADRRRSQRELFPYDRRRSQAITEPTVAYISDSGSVKI